jgi:isoleucyl-tRNA synthetase
MLVLEEARKEKHIGKGLEADVEIRFSGELLNELTVWSKYSTSLKEILNVSKVTLIDDPSNKIAALPASGHKCARCWNFMPEVSTYGIWQNVCTRCQNALKEMGIHPIDPTQPEATQ